MTRRALTYLRRRATVKVLCRVMKVMRRWQKPIALFIDDGHDLALQGGSVR